jgi:peptide/nickel transport system substrate-binding protein
MSARRVALVLAASLAAAAAAAPARAQDPLPSRGGTFVWGRGPDAVGLDPAHESDGESFKVCDNLYEGLVRFADDGTGTEPCLAKSWHTTADGRTWTFRLEDGVRFHCGRLLDAAAVEYSLARQWSARVPLHEDHGVGGPYPFWGYLGIDAVLESIEVLGPLAVRIRLKEPSAPFLANLACNFAAIVCPEHAREHGSEFYRHPCGTGPFRFVEWRPGDTITLERFEGYRGFAAYLDRVAFRSIADNSARFFELISGSLHGMDGLPPGEVAAIEANRNLVLVGEPGMNVAYLAMNLDHAPFGDSRVRRAVCHAVDKQAIVARLYANMAEPAVGPLPPNVFGAHPGLSDYDHDPALARELLAQAGYPEGFETTLWTMNGPRPYMPQPLPLAQALQTDLAAVGIRAKIVSFEWEAYLDRVHRGHHDLALLGWQADNGDPDNFLFVHFDKSSATPPAGNIAFYRDERVHELLRAGQSSVVPESRLPLYREAQEIIHRDAPWVPLVHTMELAAVQRDVRGFRLHPTGRLLLSRVWLAQP